MTRGMAPSPGRYVLVPALAVVVLTVVLLLSAQFLLVDELAKRTLARVQHRAGLLSYQLDAELQAAVRDVQLLARALRPDAAPAVVREELEFLQARSDKLVWLGFVSTEGVVLAGTQGWLEGRSIATRPVFRQGLRGSFVGDAHPAVALADLMAQQGAPPQDLLDIGEPVRDAQGRVVGVLTAHLGTSWVAHLRRLASGEASAAPLPGLSLHVLNGADGRSVIGSAAPPPGTPLSLDRPALVRDLAGSRYFAAAAKVGGTSGPGLLRWRVLVLQERDAALAPAWDVMRSMAALGVPAALLVGLAGMWASRRLLRPWGPLFRTVLERSPADPEPRRLAEEVSALVGEIERQRADTALSGPEALLARLARDATELRRIIDHLPVSLALIDAGYRVQYVNRAYTRLLGWTTEQVRGRIAAEFLFDAVERAEFVRHFDLLGDPPGEFGARFLALTQSGGRVAVQWQLVPMLDSDGRLLGSIAMLHDTRPELAARARADALLGRMRALADAAVDQLLSALDAQGRVLEWSRGAEHLTGVAATGALGRPLVEILGLNESIEASLLEAQRSGRCAVAWDCLVAAGHRRFEGSLYPLGLAPGNARHGVILRDFSEQHAVHEALERSEAHMRLAVRAARIGTWEVDLSGETQRVTSFGGYDSGFGMRMDRAPQTVDELYALVHPDDHAAVRAAMLATVRDDLPLRVEFRIRGELGPRWHEIHGRAIRAPDGRALRIGGIGIDTTARKQAEAELRAGRERLEQILQTMAEGLSTFDAEGRFTIVNRATERIVGENAANILGRRYDEVSWSRAHEDGAPLLPATEHPWARLRRGEGPILGKVIRLKPKGQPARTISLNAQAVLDADGRFDGAVLTFVDITERWQAERALADSQARLAAVVDSASDAIISTDLDGRISLFNPAAERIFGQTAARMQGRPLEEMLPPASRERHGAQIRAFAGSGVSRRAMGAGRVQALHSSGRPLELEASISQALVNGETVLTAILRDITERASQERALEVSRNELAELNRRLLDQEKETTRRLAQALHDGLGQTLSAIRLNWDAFGAAAPEALRAQQAERLGTLVVTANRQIRNVLRELRPPLLDDLGLAAALQTELQQQQPLAGRPRLQLRVPPRLESQRWPLGVEHAAFMIAREALVNALQHAHASSIEIFIEGDEGELRLEVRDDGSGIADEAREGRLGHLGLVGMRERARAIGARLAVGAAPCGGTTVELQWTIGDEPDLPDR